MGCSNSKNIETNEQKRPIEGVLRTSNKSNSAHSSHSAIPKSVAFEVSLDEAANGAAVSPPDTEKKSLPKRLLDRLQDEPSSPELTAEQCLEKQRKAEERRLQLLDERGRAKPAPPSPSQKLRTRGSSREWGITMTTMMAMRDIELQQKVRQRKVQTSSHENHLTPPFRPHLLGPCFALTSFFISE